MKIILTLFLLLGVTQVALADRWDFLPSEPLFAPLIGDLREMQDSVVVQPDSSHFDGAFGQTIEFLQWQPNETEHWSWGLEGAVFLQLDSLGGAVFPLRGSDWYLGTYFAEKVGDFSQRLEFEHVSSHLGDEFFYTVQRIIYSRESLRYTASYNFSDSLRVYGGPCFWTHISPDTTDPRLFFHAGLEVYTPFDHFIFGTHVRGYGTYDLKVLGEAGGVLDNTFQLGLEFKFKEDTHQSIRTAILFYTGNSPYGQFYASPDTYWGLGIFFTP